MVYQVPALFDPRKGAMPYEIAGEDVNDVDEFELNVFELAPNSSLLVYAVFLLGVASGVSLLLGIRPRWGAVGAFFFLCNLLSHNSILFDSEYRMNKMWAFFLTLLPLDHCTVYDDFGGLLPFAKQYLSFLPSSLLRQPRQRQQTQSTSWPMWPFRLWQVYMCLIYLGAGLCKFNSDAWKDGTALSWLWYDETLGRFYPSFVNEALYNRLIAVNLQTWMSLLIENLCYITIWPQRTRKATFFALFLLHVGIELGLQMHIFEYLSMLGWLSFFAYPNDGISNNAKDVIKNKKYGEKNSTMSWSAAFGSNRKKKLQTVVAISLLYLLIFDVFPREETEELMPAPIRYLVWKFVYPIPFARRSLIAFSRLIGLSTGPYILFKGIPPAFQNRMTAVVRFNDGTEPFLYEEANWATSSFLSRELDYWFDTYEYYIMEPVASEDYIPFYAIQAVRFAEQHAKGGINRLYDEVTIKPSNTVESVSIVVHRRDGSTDPLPDDLSLFAPIPREWNYQSTCQFVFSPQEEDHTFQFMLSSLWEDAGEDAIRVVKNGCANLDSADEALHRRGQYGEPEEDDDESGDDEEGGDDESGDDEEGGDDEYGGGFAQQMNRGDDDKENREYEENEGDDDGRRYDKDNSGDNIEPFLGEIIGDEQGSGDDGTSIRGGPSGDASEEENNGDDKERSEENDDGENNGDGESEGDDGGTEGAEHIEPNSDASGDDGVDDGSEVSEDQNHRRLLRQRMTIRT
jgi:hypothetical protein